MTGLRRAGQLNYLPCGLLTRAWLRYRSGDIDGAHADLGEAWEITERDVITIDGVSGASAQGPLAPASTDLPW